MISRKLEYSAKVNTRKFRQQNTSKLNMLVGVKTEKKKRVRNPSKSGLTKALVMWKELFETLKMIVCRSKNGSLLI